MLRLSRKIGEAVYLLDEDSNVIATIRVMPTHRKGQTSLGLEMTEGINAIREEVGLNAPDTLHLKFTRLMFRIGREDLIEKGMDKAVTELSSDRLTEETAKEVAELKKQWEKAIDERDD